MGRKGTRPYGPQPHGTIERQCLKPMRRVNDGTYNVDFNDTGGALLNKAEYSVWTSSDTTGHVVKGWTAIFNDLSTAVISAGWV